MNGTLPLARARRWLLAGGFALMGFGLPFATAPVAIGMGLLAIALVLDIRGAWNAAPWREPVMAIGLVLFVLIAARTLGVDTSPAGWHRVNQYHELLLAPVLLALMRASRNRRTFFAAFLVGCLFVSIEFWASFSSVAAREEVLRMRIGAGMALAAAAFLLAMEAPPGRARWPWIAGSAWFAATVLFAMDGRTAQLALVLLAACVAWARAPRKWRGAAVLGVPALLVAIALASPGVQGRIAEMQQAIDRTQPPREDDSTGVRIQLMRITAEAVREHWQSGVGFSRYGEAHNDAARRLYAREPGGQAFLQGGWARLDNPHDEYALQLVGGGIATLALFLAWLGAALWQASRASPRVAVPLAGITLAFAMACLFNSMLLDFSGHLWVGLVAWLIARDRHSAADEDARSILIVATRQIGDVLLTTPLIHAVRERWPHANIEVIGFTGTLGMLRGNPDVNLLVEVPQTGSSALALLARLWRRHDLAFVTDVGDRAHLIGWAAAPVRSGVLPASNSSNWWKRILLTHTVIAAGDSGDVHVVGEKLALLSLWAEPREQKVRPPAARELPQEIASQLKAGLVVVHAPSMWSYKQWPVAHFEHVVREFVAQGRQVVLTGSSSERDQQCIAPLKAVGPSPQVLDVSGQLDFGQLVTLFARAALYIGPDTSVSHLAAATGVPVIAIFGPTNPVRWGPVPAEAAVTFHSRARVQHAGNITLMQSELRCVPCARAGCDDHRESRSDCLVDISPQRVLTEATRILNRGQIPISQLQTQLVQTQLGSDSN